MVGNIVYEHGHRLIAALVGLSTLVLAVWTQRAESRLWVRVLAWCALAAIVAQATLGGLTVLNLRPPAVSAIHACLAQAFFALVAVLALVTSPGWASSEGTGSVRGPARAPLRALSVAAAAAVYGQLILGASVRHLQAALAIPDFPLMFGGLWPPAEKLAEPAVAVQLAHRLGAAVVFVLAVWAAVKAILSGAPALRPPAVILLSLLPVQVLLGASTVWSKREYLPATAHVAVGALVLVSSVVLAVRVFRAGEGRSPAVEAPGRSPARFPQVREAVP